MKFDDALLDEIRARLSVSDVVGRRVRLKRSGREFCGLSPFNPEKSPSFFVNDQKGFYHCFSSGKHGDIFRFLMETEGLSFPQAVEQLAQEAGVNVPKSAPMTQEQKREYAIRMAKIEEERRQREEAAKKEREEDEARRIGTAGGIWRSSRQIDGTQAERYLAGRGIDASRIDRSQLRFHPRLPHPAGGYFEALIARVSNVDGKGVGIWRIFLGDGPKGRAPVKPNKMGLGLSAGCAVQLGGVAEDLGIAEGIESALAACELNDFSFPVWPTLSTEGMRSFVVPAGVLRLWIFRDLDVHRQHKDGTVREGPGLAAARDLVERLADWPGQVQIIDRPAGSPESCDWVDILRLVKGLPPE